MRGTPANYRAGPGMLARHPMEEQRGIFVRTRRSRGVSPAQVRASCTIVSSMTCGGSPVILSLFAANRLMLTARKHK
jgi:hypothetical protein